MNCAQAGAFRGSQSPSIEVCPQKSPRVSAAILTKAHNHCALVYRCLMTGRAGILETPVRFRLHVLAALGLATTSSFGPAHVQESPPGRRLASNGFQCHGTNGRGSEFDAIAGKSRGGIYKKLKDSDWQRGQRDHAKHASNCPSMNPDTGANSWTNHVFLGATAAGVMGSTLAAATFGSTTSLAATSTPAAEKLHIIGDASATTQPRAGHTANQQAEVRADAISRILSGVSPNPAPVTNSACCSTRSQPACKNRFARSTG